MRLPTERGEPRRLLQFASSLALGGYGRGVLCTSVTGRPIKVSGNPLHPASQGATDVFAEAAVFSLYDPDRSQVVRHHGEIALVAEHRRRALELGIHLVGLRSPTLEFEGAQGVLDDHGQIVAGTLEHTVEIRYPIAVPPQEETIAGRRGMDSADYHPRTANFSRNCRCQHAVG